MSKAKRDKPSTARAVPYVSGFRPPTTRAILGAGKGELTPGVRLSLSAGLWDPLPKCTSEDDWLAQYSEPGQSLNQFIGSCPWLSKRCKVEGLKESFVTNGCDLPSKYLQGCIYVLPLGEFDRRASFDFDSLIECARTFFGYEVKKLPTAKLKFDGTEVYWVEEEANVDAKTSQIRSHHLSSRYNNDTKERQLRVDTGLLCLKNLMPSDGICMMILTMCDLYAEATDLFVAGIAQMKYRMGIFTLHRYDPNLSFSTEFWFEKQACVAFSEEERKRVMLQRSCRLLVHETMHLLGFNHCIYYSCCMNGSGHLIEDFSQPMYLSPMDHDKLQTLFGFNTLDRYRNLERFFLKYGMTEESNWMKIRIKKEVE